MQLGQVPLEDLDRSRRGVPTLVGRGPLDRAVGRPAYPDRHPPLGLWSDANVTEGEELALVLGGPAPQGLPATDVVVQAPALASGVDSARRELVVEPTG